MYMDDYRRWLEADLEDPALKQELQEARQQAEETWRYAAGLEYALRHIPGVVVHNHESKNRDP